MALILCWWSCDGAPVDERAWSRMLRVAKREAGDRGSAPVVREAPGFRAAWIRTTRLEPGPVPADRPESCELRDARHADARPQGRERTATEPEAAIRFEGDRMVLSRDLLGQRPLVWTRVGSQVLAASREEILLAHPGVDTRFDDFHVACVLAWCDPPEDSTPFAHIRAVPAGARV